jgi:hypothetical protein
MYQDQSKGDDAQTYFDIFCAADGGGIQATNENSTWLNQHIRFVAFCAGGASGREEPFEDVDEDSWTLCIVGSEHLNSTKGFLQVVSWDTKVFRYYGVRSPRWS